jgi:tetratricopeptide (TPR) repeat protein
MTDSHADPAIAEQLAASFKADPDRRFSEEEAATLAAAADGDVWAAKAAALHYFRIENFEAALAFMRTVLDREPGAENVRNVAVALRSLGRLQEAADWIEGRRESFDPIEYHDLLCSQYCSLGKRDEAVAQGEIALRLKDEAAPLRPLPDPVVHRFDVDRRSRNVIAFSVWGTDVRYLSGAVTNAVVARYLYPGWTPLFYTDRSTPQAFRDELARNGARIVVVDDLPAGRFGLFWRFLVEDDPEVDIYVVRDADSVMTMKERWAVADWLESGKAFHIMRDNPQHSELILAGMWGAHRGNIGGMRDKIVACVRAGRNVGNYLNQDQHFLRTEIWPIARNSVKIHDGYFDFMSPTRFSQAFALPRPMHVGQNDWVNFRWTPNPPAKP